MWVNKGPLLRQHSSVRAGCVSAQDVCGGGAQLSMFQALLALCFAESGGKKILKKIKKSPLAINVNVNIICSWVNTEIRNWKIGGKCILCTLLSCCFLFTFYMHIYIYISSINILCQIEGS